MRSLGRLNERRGPLGWTFVHSDLNPAAGRRRMMSRTIPAAARAHGLPRHRPPYRRSKLRLVSEEGGSNAEKHSDLFRRHRPGRRGASRAAHQQHLQNVSHFSGPRRYRDRSGLGTDVGTTALISPVRSVQKLLGSVTGAGIKRNIADCYSSSTTTTLATESTYSASAAAPTPFAASQTC
jgi:hypothetical protein